MRSMGGEMGEGMGGGEVAGGKEGKRLKSHVPGDGPDG